MNPMALRRIQGTSVGVVLLGTAVAAVVATAGLVALEPAPVGAIGPVGGPSEYRNPVHEPDFPDPFVLRAGSTYYAYGTHRGLANIQILRSDDLVSWRDLGTALPFLPDWAAGPWVWAPSVLARPGAHVLYYAVAERASGLFCVSAAVSVHGPQGPFIDRSREPLVCQRDRRGTIDPSPFVDPAGTPWLLFKSEGIEHREPTRIWIQQLAPDGRSLVGPKHELLATEQAWEEPIIENPAMIAADGRYFLFYSANRWRSADYAVGHAVCDAPTGPCRRVGDGPLFASANGAAGPGGVELFTDPDGGTWMAYHAWTAGQVGYPEGARSLRIDRVTFAQGRAWVSAPTTGPTSFRHIPGPPPAPAAPAPPPARGVEEAPPAPPGHPGEERGARRTEPAAAGPVPGELAPAAASAPPGDVAQRLGRALPELHPPAGTRIDQARALGTGEAPPGLRDPHRFDPARGGHELALGGAGGAGDASPPVAVSVAAVALVVTGIAAARASRRPLASAG